MIKRPEERIPKVGPQRYIISDCAICSSANRAKIVKKYAPTRSLSNPTQKYLLRYQRNSFYGSIRAHQMSCQLQAIDDIFNFDTNDPTSRPRSDRFSVISAGQQARTVFSTVRTNNSRTVACEWTCESTDNISASDGNNSHSVQKLLSSFSKLHLMSQ